MGYLAFLVTVCFVPTFPAGATVPRWALLAAILPSLIVWCRTPIGRNVWLVVGYVTVMVVLSPNWYYAFEAYALFAILVCAFCLGRTLNDLKPVFIGAALGLWCNSAAIVAQNYFGWFVMHTTPNSGLFGNRNMAVEAAMMVAIAVSYYRLWWLLPGIIPTLLAGARAPILAGGIMGLFLLWRWSKTLALTVFTGAFLFVVYTFVELDPKMVSTFERIAVWRDIVPALTFAGHGFGSFGFEFPLLQRHTDALFVRFDHPHNEPLQLIYEFGAVGVAFIALFFYRMARVEVGAVWCALAVFFIEGLLAMPLYQPVTGFLAALCAGHIYRSGARLRWNFDAGRFLLWVRHEAQLRRVFRDRGQDIPA